MSLEGKCSLTVIVLIYTVYAAIKSSNIVLYYEKGTLWLTDLFNDYNI